MIEPRGCVPGILTWFHFLIIIFGSQTSLIPFLFHRRADPLSVPLKTTSSSSTSGAITAPTAPPPPNSSTSSSLYLGSSALVRTHPCPCSSSSSPRLAPSFRRLLLLSGLYRPRRPPRRCPGENIMYPSTPFAPRMRGTPPARI